MLRYALGISSRSRKATTMTPCLYLCAGVVLLETRDLRGISIFYFIFFFFWCVHPKGEIAGPKWFQMKCFLKCSEYEAFLTITFDCVVEKIQENVYQSSYDYVAICHDKVIMRQEKSHNGTKVALQFLENKVVFY